MRILHDDEACVDPEEEARRILAELDAIQRAAARGKRDAASLARARGWIGHANNDVRWQALIAVGEWIETDPDVVWEVVVEHGQSEDEDMRAGVATVLLEHLLEDHFDAYFPRVRRRIEGRAHRLADTLSRCSAFGEAKARWDEVRALLERAEHEAG